MDQDYIIYYHYDVLKSKVVRSSSLKAAKRKMERHIKRNGPFGAVVDGGISLEEEQQMPTVEDQR